MYMYQNLGFQSSYLFGISVPDDLYVSSVGNEEDSDDVGNAS